MTLEPLRKERQDRFRATAMETDEHLHRCLVYIDLNMVRRRCSQTPYRMGAQRLSRDSETARSLWDYRPPGIKRIMWLCGSG